MGEGGGGGGCRKGGGGGGGRAGAGWAGAPPAGTDSHRREPEGEMADREGFEPSSRVTPSNGLASRRLQPLGHLSARPQPGLAGKRADFLASRVGPMQAESSPAALLGGRRCSRSAFGAQLQRPLVT